MKNCTVWELLSRTAKKHSELSDQFLLLSYNHTDQSIVWLLGYLSRHERVTAKKFQLELASIPDTNLRQALVKVPEWINRDIEFDLEMADITTVDELIEKALHIEAQLMEGLWLCCDQISTNQILASLRKLIDQASDLQYQIAHAFILEVGRSG